MLFRSTLIELLVVIAIIGVLASVVLAATNSARNKGADAAVKSNLANTRAQAELYYDANSSSYSGVCSTTAVGGVRTINDIVAGARAAYGTTVALNITLTSAGAWNTATCHDSATAWAAEVPLKASTSGTPSMYCVDSTGVTKTNTAALASSAVAC